jgi:peptidoglycan/LPS O-acetylase OafA/YrhL
LKPPFPALLSLPVSLLFAWGANHLVERPSHRLRNRLLARWQERSTYAEAAPAASAAER